ncbi:MAG: alpha/beta hydrolase [Actinomycetota bacterium]|nr:alpha/beta hydrolase [Actinomycetota bacterium]
MSIAQPFVYAGPSERLLSDGAPLVLLIPGLGGGGEQLETVAAMLVANGVASAIAVGVVHSDVLTEVSEALPQVAEALAEHLMEIGAAVHVVGHSLGSFVAFELAALHPELIRSVTIVNGGLGTVGKFLRSPIGTFARHPRTCSHAVILFALLGLPIPDFLTSHVSGSSFAMKLVLRGLIEPVALDNPEVRRQVSSGAGQTRILRLLASNRDQWARFTRLAPQITQHVIFLAGSEDRLAPLQDTRELAAMLNSASVCVLPGVAHAAPLEAPEAVVEAIMSRVRPSDSDC